MKTVFRSTMVLLVAACGLLGKINTTTQVKGPYLGQSPPGKIPTIFAPGLISTDLGEGCSGWGNDMEYFIFQRWDNGKARLYILNQENGVWSEPELLPFVEKYQVGDFTIAPDGKTLVFASRIFIEEIGAEGEGGNIWMVEKTSTGWTEPKHVGPPVNTKFHDSYPCISANGNMYFFSVKYIVTALGLFVLCVYERLFIVRIGMRAILIFYLVVLAHHMFLIFPG